MEKIITFGEIMLRLTPPEYHTLDQTNTFVANYGGCEANVAVSLSHFKHHTYFMSKLPLNELGDAAVSHLMSHGVSADYIKRGGDTMGIYFLQTGFGGRSSKVVYNRKYSAVTTVTEDDFDFDEIFKDATWFHLSGISLAIGDKVRAVAMKALEACKKYGVKVSFDFNYRSRLWTLEKAIPCYKEIMPYVDVLFASYFDCTKILGFVPDVDIVDNNEQRINVFRKVLAEYDIHYLFGTDRIVYSASENSLSAFAISMNNTRFTEPIRFNIYDRIGGGDAFAAGVIHGLLKNNMKEPSYALQFGLVTSVLKHTLYGDVCALSEDDIIDFMNTRGAPEVKR